MHYWWHMNIDREKRTKRTSVKYKKGREYCTIIEEEKEKIRNRQKQAEHKKYHIPREGDKTGQKCIESNQRD